MNAARRDNDPMPDTGRPEAGRFDTSRDAGRPDGARADAGRPPKSPGGKTAPSAVDEHTTLRRSLYGLFIALAIGGLCGRILAVDSVNMFALEETLYRQGRPDWFHSRPFLSANDRSRWDTIRSLVEKGTYAIDDIVDEQGWDTIDMVQHLGSDGQKHLYSSKPPLLATLMAVPYWLVYKTTGWGLNEYTYELGRGLLILYNVPLLVAYFLILISLAERFGVTTWGRLFMMALATGGTLLTTFAVSITNHLPAAVAAAALLLAFVRIWHDEERRWPWFVVAGLAGGFLFAFELPALAMLALVAVALGWRAPRMTLIAFAPAALAVVLAQYGTNYIAHGSLREPYAHRSETDPSDNWYKFTYMSHGRERESYWAAPVGIDQGEPSIPWYVFHCLIGHHGLFSLTPAWILSVAGFGFWVRFRDRRALALGIAGVTLVVLGFYLLRPQLDRNYGGMSSGLRWMFWFTPLWLVLMLPAVDWLASRRWGRGLAIALLALSALSSSYPTWSPWQATWIMKAMEHKKYLDWKNGAEEEKTKPAAVAVP